MNDKYLKNQTNAFHENTVLEDYEIEIVKKISFWTNLFYKIKSKNLKLLSSSNTKPHQTYKSISYMWNLGCLKASIFNTLDSLKLPFYKKSSNNPQIVNTYNISNNNTSIIIPKPITLVKNIK